MIEKFCPGCKIIKPIELYSKCHSNPHGLQSRCKACNAESHRKWRSTPNAKISRRKVNMRFWYGLERSDYDKMVLDQDGVCYICKKTDKNRELCVDHCHTTGKVRKLLCKKCNSALGLLKEDEQIAKNMLEYILYCQRIR